MVNKLIDVYLVWHFKKPKWARVILKCVGFVLVWSTVWIWLPAMFVIWFVSSIIIAMIEFIERA